MTLSQGEIEEERRRNRIAGIAGLAGVVLFVGAGMVGGEFNGAGTAEQLRLAEEGETDLLLQSVLQMLAVILFVPALIALFNSIKGRSSTVRTGLIGLVVASPILLAGSFLLVSFAYEAAADALYTPPIDPSTIPPGPFGEVGGTLATLGHQVLANLNEHADDVFFEQAVTQLRTGLGLAGALGLAFAMAYMALQAMRTGLLSRFWGSLSIALGVGSLLFGSPMLLAYMLVISLLLSGFWPGQRPPAWELGEALPWPRPGGPAPGSEEEAGEEPARPEDFEGQATEVGADPRPARRENRRRRKRKQRG